MLLPNIKLNGTLQPWSRRLQGKRRAKGWRPLASRSAPELASKLINQRLENREIVKYALVNQQRQEPEPSLLGNCPACGQRMVAKCGDVKVWHWAHRGRRHCDHWWENETEWHRAWKDNFPRHWQEVLHKATTGERHIADVKTDHDWVIEFQHSHLKPDERRSRDDFYPKLIWVVDATRRKRDRERLFTAWKNGTQCGNNQLLRKALQDNCILLQEWADVDAPVFFDVGDTDQIVWRVAKSSDGSAYLMPYSRGEFVQIHQGATPEATGKFDQFLQEIPKLVRDYEESLRGHALRQAPVLIPSGFSQRSNRMTRRSRRF